MTASRLELLARVWAEPTLAHGDAVLLTVLILRADAVGMVQLPTSELRRLTRMRRTAVRAALDSLQAAGVLTLVGEHRGNARARSYRINPGAIPAAALSADAGSSGRRDRPGRHRSHRLEVDQAEASEILGCLERRLADTEAALALPGAEREDPARYAQLLRERDYLAEDLLPRYRAFAGLFG